MPTSIITVYNTQRGRPEENAKVVLEWNGFVNLGQTRPVYTDRDGNAVIEHASNGNATIYVNGKKVDSFYAPGSYTVKI